MLWESELIRSIKLRNSIQKEMTMKRKLIVVLAVVMVLAMASVPALASPPQTVGGIWCYTPTETIPLKIDGGTVHLGVYDDGDWTGSITGASSDYGVAVFHESGRGLYMGTMTFDSVDVNGTSGGLVMLSKGSQPTPFDDWQGQWHIASGDGDLVALRGQGIWWGPGWQGDPNECGVIHYSGEVFFLGQ
jgi:hypothetical protein